MKTLKRCGATAVLADIAADNELFNSFYCTDEAYHLHLFLTTKLSNVVVV